MVIADSDINASSADAVVGELEKTIDGGARKMVVDLSRLGVTFQLGQNMCAVLDMSTALDGRNQMRITKHKAGKARMESGVMTFPS